MSENNHDVYDIVQVNLSGNHYLYVKQSGTMSKRFTTAILLIILMAGSALPQSNINPHGFKAARVYKLQKQAREKAGTKNYAEAISLVEQAMDSFQDLVMKFYR